MIEQTKIKNILFDLGGVILNIDYLLTINEFNKLGVKNSEEIFSQFKQASFANDFETGKITENEFYQEIIKVSGVNFDFFQFKKAWNAMLLDLPERRIFLLKKLAEKYRLFLFSNTNQTHYKQFITLVESDFNTIFEKTYYSHTFGKRKPDPDSFFTILNENGLKPNETLFVDDSIQHIASAIKIGISTLHLTESDVLTEFKEWV